MGKKPPAPFPFYRHRQVTLKALCPISGLPNDNLLLYKKGSELQLFHKRLTAIPFQAGALAATAASPSRRRAQASPNTYFALNFSTYHGYLLTKNRLKGYILKFCLLDTQVKTTTHAQLENASHGRKTTGLSITWRGEGLPATTCRKRLCTQHGKNDPLHS